MMPTLNAKLRLPSLGIALLLLGCYGGRGGSLKRIRIQHATALLLSFLHAATDQLNTPLEAARTLNSDPPR
jgi:hypothetical protein